MKDSYLEPDFNPVDEARRYVENAHAVLRENGKLDAGFQLANDIIERCEKLIGH